MSWLAVFSLLGADAAPKTFSLEAARSIVTVSEPAVSPDGTRVVYLREHPDFKANKTLGELVLADVTSGTTRMLTHDREGVDAPAWSPQGNRLAFLAAPQSGKPAQLFVMPMDGGDALKVTANKSGVSAFAWKPDGTALAYASEDDAPNAAAIEKGLDAFEVGADDHFLSRAASLPSHLWLVSADGTNAKQLTKGTSSDGAWLGWSPDGKTLIFGRQPDAAFAHFTKVRAVALDVATGTERAFLPAPLVSFATYSRDGTRVAYLAPRHGSLYLQNDAYVVKAADGAPLGNSLAIDRDGIWTGLLPDGSLAYGASDGVRNALWIVPPGGAPKRVDLGDVDFAPDATIANDGTLAFVGRSKSRPAEIYVLQPKGAAPRRISNENAFIDGYALGRAERIDWDIDDGMRACGVLTYPPGFVPGRTYPLVLVIHGGPVSTSTWNFNVTSQTLAARGFLVFNPNYRGSDDLGDAYLQAIVGHPTSGPDATT